MNFPCPEGSNELLPNIMRMSHIRLGDVEDDSYTGTRDGHLETGARAGAGRDAGHGLDTVRVQVRVVQQQVGSTQRQRTERRIN